MIRAIISDVSYVLLFPKNKGYKGILNRFYEQIKEEENFSFFNHFELNTELLNFYESIKNKVDLVIYTSDFIQDDPEIRRYFENVFSKIYSAKKMNTSKSKTEGYKKIISELGIPANAIVFIDDDKENLKTGEEVGLKVIHYKNNLELLEELKMLLNI